MHSNTVSTVPSSVIRLHSSDNVGVRRLELVTIGTENGSPRVTTSVPEGHKVALRQIHAGDAIIKYGHVIGYASLDIQVGEHVHTHNVVAGENASEHQICLDAKKADVVPETARPTFEGYKRTNGRVGTRNYIAILSSVNCSATVAHAVARNFTSTRVCQTFQNVDGVVALTHGGGCAINPKSEGYEYLTRTLAGYARNPNVGGVLMVGLGCETNQIADLVRAHSLVPGVTLKSLAIQDSGGTRKCIAAAIEAVVGMLHEVNKCVRSTALASDLTIGLQCGGSDGYSGISANPALGHASDLLIRNGGAAVLSETPEIYGAEHLLTRRAATPAIAGELLQRIAWWKEYARKNGAELDNNPSHGNKAGGLTTIAEKSLGAVAKSGTTRLEAVYEYGELISSRGLVFMDTPGYDPMSVAGQVAGGCNLIIFTTGRGSAAGYKPVPCIKLATNTPMFERMLDDMDLDCGGIITGESSIEEVGERIFRKILEVASGKRSRSEELDYGDHEFVPWQPGAVL